MSPKQKVLVAQLQIGGCGLIILIFSLFNKIWPLVFLGIFVIAYAVLRFILLMKIMKQNESELPENLEQDKTDEEEEDESFW